MASASLSWWRVSLVVGLSTFVFEACGLSVVGTATDEVDGSAPTTVDSGPTTDAPVEAAQRSDASFTETDCDDCKTLDSKWSPVAFATGTTAKCPADSATTAIVQTDPVAAADACSCKITPTPPDCSNGPVTFKVGPGCNMTGVVTTVTNQSCHQVSGGLDAHVSFAQIPVKGGSCVAQAMTDGSKVTTSPATLCTPPAACTGSICNKVAPPGLKACIVADGDVACDQPGFTEKHSIGGGGSLKCDGDCGTCTAQNPTCSVVSIDLYGPNNCGGAKVFTLQANTCTDTGMAANSSIGSMIYHATPQATYAASKTPTATATLSTPRTVCCAP